MEVFALVRNRRLGEAHAGDLNRIESHRPIFRATQAVPVYFQHHWVDASRVILKLRQIFLNLAS